MQYQHTKREPEMAELIEGSERDRRSPSGGARAISEIPLWKS